MKGKSLKRCFVVSTLNLRCAVTLMLGAMLAHGQTREFPAPPPSPVHSSPSALDHPDLIFGGNPDPVLSKNAKEGNCFLPPLNTLRTGMVRVVDLQVPAKTRREYEAGCVAVRNRKLADAENHLRKAVNQYAKYSASWVLLGQVLEAQQKTEAARDACTRPLTASANYLPAYLCLIDISARLKNWDEVLKLSTRALAIDPTTDAAAYAYNATANLNLHHLSDAEQSALKASEIDKSNSDPRVHYLLAQIYAAKGDRLSEAAQLREYLKYVTDPDDAAVVKNYLAKLDGKNHQ